MVNWICVAALIAAIWMGRYEVVPNSILLDRWTGRICVLYEAESFNVGYIKTYACKP